MQRGTHETLLSCIIPPRRAHERYNAKNARLQELWVYVHAGRPVCDGGRVIAVPVLHRRVRRTFILVEADQARVDAEHECKVDGQRPYITEKVIDLSTLIWIYTRS